MMSYLCGSCGTGKWAPYGLLVLRVAVGAIFLVHGIQKITMMGVDGVAGFFGSVGIPFATLAAIVVITVETLGGAALILGVFTHWVSKLLAIVMVVAIFTVHLPNGFFASNNGYEFPLALLAGAIALMANGPGALALTGKQHAHMNSGAPMQGGMDVQMPPQN